MRQSPQFQSGSIVRSAITVARQNFQVTNQSFRAYLVIFAFFTLALFGANFLLSPLFGLYEDDLIFFSNAFNELPPFPVSEVVKFSQGRPINNIMQWFGSLTIYVSQSLFVTYLVFCVLLGVGLYVWFRVFSQRQALSISLLAALLIGLLPLHTLTSFLNGAVGFWLAMVLSGGAILLLNRSGILSATLGYACSLLVLMTYEAFFPLIYAGHFLSKNWLSRYRVQRDAVVSIIVQFIILTMILIAYSTTRELSGQRTASDLVSSHGAVGKGFYDMGIAAMVGIGSSFRYLGQIVQVRYLTAELISLGIIVGSIIFIFYQFIIFTYASKIEDQRAYPLDALIEGFIAALLLLVLGYVFTYFVTGGNLGGVALVERSSRVNIAGVYGHSLLLALMLSLSWRFFPEQPKIAIRAAILLPFIIVLTVERIGVQTEYVSFWGKTKEQLREIILLTPDAQRGTAVLLEGNYGQYLPTPAMGYEPQGMPFLIDALFDIPNQQLGGTGVSFEDKPIIQRVMLPTWPMGLEYAGDGRLVRKKVLEWNGWDWPELTFRVGNVIHLKQDQTFRITRSNQQIRIDNIEILKPSPSDALAPGFWDLAIPRPTLRRMMPDFEMWFLHYQRMRADLRTAKASGEKRSSGTDGP